MAKKQSAVQDEVQVELVVADDSQENTEDNNVAQEKTEDQVVAEAEAVVLEAEAVEITVVDETQGSDSEQQTEVQLGVFVFDEYTAAENKVQYLTDRKITFAMFDLSWVPMEEVQEVMGDVKKAEMFYVAQAKAEQKEKEERKLRELHAWETITHGPLHCENNQDGTYTLVMQIDADAENMDTIKLFTEYKVAVKAAVEVETQVKDVLRKYMGVAEGESKEGLSEDEVRGLIGVRQYTMDQTILSFAGNPNSEMLENLVREKGEEEIASLKSAMEKEIETLRAKATNEADPFGLLANLAKLKGKKAKSSVSSGRSSTNSGGRGSANANWQFGMAYEVWDKRSDVLRATFYNRGINDYTWEFADGFEFTSDQTAYQVTSSSKAANLFAAIAKARKEQIDVEEYVGLFAAKDPSAKHSVSGPKLFELDTREGRPI